MFKDYLKQPSTWLGLLKIGSSVGLLSGGLVNALGAAVVAAFGVVDVIRNEKTK